MARAHDELVGRLVGPGFLALGRLTPRSDRMTATGGAAFTTTVRMVDRVHGDTAIVRAATAPTATAGLAIVHVAVVRVRHSADRCKARAVHDALFARIEAQDRHALVAPDELGIGAGRPRDLATLARLQLDVVDDGADRHRRKRHGIARLHVHGLARHDLVTGGDALRRQDVGELAVLVFDQRNESGPVRIIFKTLDRCRHVELAALEVDDAVRTLVAATDETRRHAAVIVTPARRGQPFGQALYRLALVEARTVDDHQLALTWRYRLEFLECHCLVLTASQRPVATSIDWPSARVTTAFFTSLCRPVVLRKRFTFPLRSSVLTDITFTPNSASIAALISGLVALRATLKTTWFCSEAMVDFSVMTGLTITS